MIDGESDTLADFNIFPGDLLWVTDSEIHEYRDIAGNNIFSISIVSIWILRELFFVHIRSNA